MDWHQLSKMKVDALREKAKQFPDIGAVSGLSKVKLVEVLAKHMGISHPHKRAEGIDKASLKGQIHELKKQRDAAIAAKDHAELKKVRRALHHKRRALHKAASLVS